MTALIEMSEGVKILYKDSIDNILFLKRQQWIITNYALIAYAAVAALSKGANNIESTLLTIVSFAAWCYATFCMVDTQIALTKYRSRLDNIYRTYFTAAERETFALWPSKPNFHYAPGFIYGLLSANLIAFAATVYLIWRATPQNAFV